MDPERQQVDEFGLQIGEARAVHEPIFLPDRKTVFGTDHLGAEAVVRRHSAQGSCQDQVRLEHCADLLRRQPAAGQREHRIPGQDRDHSRLRVAEPVAGLLGDGRAKMLRNSVGGGEGQDGEARDRHGGHAAKGRRFRGEAVAALVDGLDAIFRLEPLAQRGKTLWNAVSGRRLIAPERLFQLERSDDPALPLKQQPQRRQLSCRQRNRRPIVQERPIRIQPGTAKPITRLRDTGRGRFVPVHPLPTHFCTLCACAAPELFFTQGKEQLPHVPSASAHHKHPGKKCIADGF
jgi:hypothetical protein